MSAAVFPYRLVQMSCSFRWLTVASKPFTLVISGVYRSSTPFPEGPLTRSYAGCLSAHAVCPPLALTTSKIVLVRNALCENPGKESYRISRARIGGQFSDAAVECAGTEMVAVSGVVHLVSPFSSSTRFFATGQTLSSVLVSLIWSR